MSDQKPGILYLDDEEQNLLSFQALFRRDFRVFTTTQAHEAVDILNREEIHVIFSDQKMPDVSGVEFFENILHEYPKPIRILLTGHADAEAIIDAINKGQVYRYVAKPWDANDLRICIDNALEKYHRESEIQAKNEALELTHADLEHILLSTVQDLRDALLQIGKQLESADQHAINMAIQEQQRALHIIDELSEYYQHRNSIHTASVIDFSQLQELMESEWLAQHPDSNEKPGIEIHTQEAFKSDATQWHVIIRTIARILFKAEYHQSLPNFHIQQNTEKLSLKINDPQAVFSVDMQHVLMTDAPKIEDLRYVSLHILRRSVRRLHGKISCAQNSQGMPQIIIEVPNSR
ncbi:MAG: response regulator [Flavobacteriales bacterium]